MTAVKERGVAEEPPFFLADMISGDSSLSLCISVSRNTVLSLHLTAHSALWRARRFIQSITQSFHPFWIMETNNPCQREIPLLHNSSLQSLVNHIRNQPGAPAHTYIMPIYELLLGIKAPLPSQKKKSLCIAHQGA